LLQPFRRLDMQLRDQIRLRLLQTGAQQIDEKVVIAEPQAFFIQ